MRSGTRFPSNRNGLRALRSVEPGPLAQGLHWSVRATRDDSEIEVARFKYIDDAREWVDTLGDHSMRIVPDTNN